jgi:nitrous oxide reductase accessory protein NosL
VIAEAAVYVVGIERQGIMGEPVLAYANERAAQRAVRGHRDARILDMAGLRDWWQALETAH